MTDTATSIPRIDRTRAEGALTGARYLESLRDHREIWYRGERIADVTTHPEFREMAQSLARIYDMQHAPETRDVMTFEQENGSSSSTSARARSFSSRTQKTGTRPRSGSISMSTSGVRRRRPRTATSCASLPGSSPEMPMEAASSSMSGCTRPTRT